jgi:hypothetical protein
MADKPEKTQIVSPETTAPKKQDTVVLSTEAFNSMMERLNKLENDQKLVLETADKRQISKIEEMRRQGKLVKDVKLRVVDGKIVIGWKTKEDEVYFADGKLIENQKVEVFFEDKTSKVLTMRQWAALPSYRPFEVIRESRAENGQLFFRVRQDDGKEIEIDQTYIN